MRRATPPPRPAMDALILLQTLLNPYQNCSYYIFQAEIPVCVSSDMAPLREGTASARPGRPSMAKTDCATGMHFPGIWSLNTPFFSA